MRKSSVEGLDEVGVLRLDLVSNFETEALITEILTMVKDEIYDCFEVNTIITKAIPMAEQRVNALIKHGYQKSDDRSTLPFDNYYFSVKGRT